MTGRSRPSGALPIYSYDLIDNFGNRSPKELTPGVENLARGQKLMSIFELVDFERNGHLTVTMSDPRAISIFGRIALSYVVLPISDDSCRLVAKMRVRYPRRAPWSWMRWFLPWGDLLMMRKQFLTLKHLAEDGRVSLEWAGFRRWSGRVILGTGKRG